MFGFELNSSEFTGKVCVSDGVFFSVNVPVLSSMPEEMDVWMSELGYDTKVRCMHS